MALRRYKLPSGPRETRYKAPATSPEVEARISRARARRGAKLIDEVAYMFGVAHSTVVSWEERGWLRIRRPRHDMALIRWSAIRKLIKAHPELGARAKRKRQERAKPSDGSEPTE